MTGLTRRHALAAAAAAGLPAVLRAAPAAAQAESDRDVLSGLIELEREGEARYRALGRDAFARQQAAHVAVLEKELTAIGGQPPAAAPAPQAEAGNAGVKAAADLELRTIKAYHDAVQMLSRARLVQIATSAMANHGQHLVVLRQALGVDPVPKAFEDGTPAR